MTDSEHARLLALARRRPLLSAHDVGRAGIHSQYLTRLLADGEIERVARGQYRVTERPVSEHYALAIAAKVVPSGVICLLSALTVHAIGTQLPADIWIAIERGTRTPRVRAFPLRVVRFSGAAFAQGIEVHQLEGEPVRVYSAAKTIADLFKFRNKVGLDVAIEALRDAWHERKFKMAELERAARVCRVSREA